MEREPGGGADRDGRGEETWEDQDLDEEFIREAEVSEPAARTRMLRRRWRERPPEPQPWRTEEPPSESRGRGRGSRGRGPDEDEEP